MESFVPALAAPSRSDALKLSHGRRYRTGAHRRWRRRGRRAQVAPVATILGLLLVVTYIATFLSTTLPEEMSVNDLNHDLLVENQVGQMSVVTTQMILTDSLYGQESFPISLGSAGAPPFAGPDAAAVVPLNNYTGGTYGVYVNYSITSAHGTVPVSAVSVPGAGFVVGLRNTYASASEVAFDDGAVIFAQPAGVPTIADPPPITLTSTGALSIVLPTFVNRIGTESGTSTALFTERLQNVQSVALPTAGYSITSGSSVLITIFSPYAAAWLNYYTGQPTFSGATIACTPAPTGPHSACSPSYLYVPGGQIGKVTISVPVTSLTLTQGFFGIALG